MHDLATRYADSIVELDSHVRVIADDRWHAPTPCADWDVRDLLDHVVYETLWVPDVLAGKTLDEVGNRYDGERLGDDPVGAWTRAAALARDAALADDATKGTVHTSGGETPATEYVTEMLLDTVIHGWDLARAVGIEHTIDPDTAEDLLAWFGPVAARMRSYGALAAPAEVDPDADAATQLIALSGRTP
jgi:uncharacterized protein (TIGR03086 family)